ncbi:PAS/PAC sensor signal transduction histidine kinase [Fibrella aestuarina BUZ 2]|uniref:histidine kinase n=1 Tax=Fibrella aestuarina BUZ 2 TaxID=1166018 RepID=I0K510_9BACT|nr:ATP-binding protein [Fibrella aestuarina]CCG99213.1 PAS/PAC sensor signal transduction histidine kinase [Fibrella aestuarina BUZ 2]
MTIKAKITLALAFLFAIMLLLGGVGAYYLNRLAADSQAILTDNYESLDYTSNMQKALVGLRARLDTEALGTFDDNLKRQEANVTEVGEGEATQAVRRAFNQLRQMPQDSVVVGRLWAGLFRIDDVNRQAIIRKNDVAKQTARDALVWLAVVGTLSFLVVFSMLFSFPGYIASPLRELTQGIRQVASRNFEERLHVKSSDEFGELARSFNSMAQKLDEYEHSNLARILFEKKRIDTLIQVMSDGIIGLDQNRYILFVNRVASRLLGLSEADLLAQYAPDVAARNDLMRSLIQDVMTTGAAAKDGDSTLLKIYDEGKESYFIRQTQVVDVSRTGDEQAVRAGYVIVLKNVTSYKELDLAKTNFIATVSHELKTPLSSIKMSLKLLDDQRVGELNDEQRQLVGNVRDDADRLLKLTGELLNMAQVESGQIELAIRPVAPADLVRYATQALRTQAEQRAIELVSNVPGNLPLVEADPDKTSWVLVNFLSNAIRHSPDNGRVDISATPIGQQVEFRVRDHGPGIRPEHRDRVFDRYFRAASVPFSGSSGYPASAMANPSSSGTGLGLAISKEFIQTMNGQVGLDTSVTDGAAFWFRLPVAGQTVV